MKCEPLIQFTLYYDKIMKHTTYSNLQLHVYTCTKYIGINL